MKKNCKDCGKSFTLSQGEIDFYNHKNLNLPQRCKNCRKKRKNENSSAFSSDRSINSKIRGVILVLILLFFALIPELANLLEQSESQTSNNNDTYLSPSSGTNSSSNSGLYNFRNEQYLSEHFEKHGSLLGHNSVDSYLSGANLVINSSSALKRTQSDGDTAYYLESTNEFVVVSTDRYIRTYFKPTDGIDYFYRQ